MARCGGGGGGGGRTQDHTGRCPDPPRRSRRTDHDPRRLAGLLGGAEGRSGRSPGGRAYVQTYSFEGDRAGTALTEELLRARAPGRKLLIDSYTRVNQSDPWIPAPGFLFDRTLREEVRNTRRLVGILRADGAGVRFGRPFGLLGHGILRRDHKKLLLFDDRVAYIGGINFSEHNFEWHDLMIRMEHPGVARFLRRDFLRSWEGRSERTAGSFPPLGLDLLALPGTGNRECLEAILGLIDRARSSIHIVSPYIGPPFTRHLAAAAQRGVDVHFVTPARNNKTCLQRFLFAEAAHCGFKVWLFPDRMIHMKCMLIDDHTLLAGSSNFDLLSYHGFFAELVALFRSPGLIADFRRRVLGPAVSASRRLDASQAREARGWGRLWSTAPILVAEVLARFLNPPRRRGPHGC